MTTILLKLLDDVNYQHNLLLIQVILPVIGPCPTIASQENSTLRRARGPACVWCQAIGGTNEYWQEVQPVLSNE